MCRCYSPQIGWVMESNLWFRITVISAGVLTAVLAVLLILMK
jgi:hypothetical protein